MELIFLVDARTEIEVLFDPLKELEPLLDRAENPSNLTDLDVLSTVNEFIRVLGLAVVVRGRNDLIVAETGVNLMRDMLIQAMVWENEPQPRRGVLALTRSLTRDQIAVLAQLPPLSSSWESIEARTQVIAQEFFHRTRKLLHIVGAQ